MSRETLERRMKALSTAMEAVHQQIASMSKDPPKWRVAELCYSFAELYQWHEELSNQKNSQPKAA